MTLDVVAFVCGATLFALALFGGNLSLPFLKVGVKGNLPKQTRIICVPVGVLFLATGIALNRTGTAQERDGVTPPADGGLSRQGAAGTADPGAARESSTPLAAYLLDASGGDQGDNTCEYPIAIPAGIRPADDPSEAGRVVLRALENGSATAWARTPEGRGRITVLIEIGSKVEGTTWARLSNTFRVSVRARQADAAQVNILSTCAGEGEILTAPRTIPLSAEGPREYTEEVQFPQADYFTLMPGEFESFTFLFQCRTPRVFAVGFEIPFSLDGRADHFRFRHADLVCPSSAYHWERALTSPERLVGDERLVEVSYADR